MFYNFPENWVRADCWKLFDKYGLVRDVYLPRKRLSSGQRFGFVRFEGIREVESFVRVLKSIQINGCCIRVFKALERKKMNDDPSILEEGVRILKTGKEERLLGSNGSSILPWNTICEGRKFMDVVAGNKSNLAQSDTFDYSETQGCAKPITVNIDGKIFEFNFPVSLSEYKLVFRFNKERFCWSLTEDDCKNPKVVEVVNKKGSFGSVSEKHASDCDQGSRNIETEVSSVTENYSEVSPFHCVQSPVTMDAGFHSTGEDPVEEGPEVPVEKSYPCPTLIGQQFPDSKDLNSILEVEASCSEKEVQAYEAEVVHVSKSEKEMHASKAVENSSENGQIKEQMGSLTSNLIENFDDKPIGIYNGYKNSRFQRKKKFSLRSFHHFSNYLRGKKQTKGRKHRDSLRWCERFTINKMMANLEEEVGDCSCGDCSCSDDDEFSSSNSES